MRKNFLFLIFWILLCFARVGEMLYAFAEYRVILFAEPAFTQAAHTEDERAQWAERKNALLQRAIGATVEVALLGGVCAIYFLATRAPRKELTTKC